MEGKMRVLLVLLLSCGLVDSQPVNKCHLQELMIQATKGKSNGLSDRTFMAKITCAVETVTRFNTSAVNQMTHTGNRVWKFYGIFQLTNGLTCSDDTAQLPNICGANCTDFLDDNINDDLQCLLKSFTSLIKGGFSGENFEDIRTMIMFFLPGHCKNQNGTEYFADCNKVT
ncbi:lysozyme C, milk isozyme [Takifugu rubripes]|uniref:lysozyme C, milk isozyme n=1 Tax=Takifugu rubripes TaxID=31033 RepID=UPI001145393A|nr:lysozyme C, milk isozyme-like [Takifugu rubripes]